MFYKKKGLPKENDVVICTVKKILFHSIFVDLDEYEHQDGMIHISEIAPGRIRNIRDYVVEGKKLVCLVLRVDERQRQVDLSLRRVPLSLKNRKNEEYKQEIKAEKLLEFVAKQQKTTLKDYYEKVGYKLMENFDLLSTAFNEISKKGVEAINPFGLPEKYTIPLVNIVQEKIKPIEVMVTAFVNLQNPASNGIEVIKANFATIEKFADDNKFKIAMTYISAPKYKIESFASDYKIAQEQLDRVCSKLLELAKKTNCSCEIAKKK